MEKESQSVHLAVVSVKKSRCVMHITITISIILDLKLRKCICEVYVLVCAHPRK